MNNIFINKKLLITAEGCYISRYHLLIKALQKHFDQVETLDFPPPLSHGRRFILKIINRIPYLKAHARNVDQSITPGAFKYRSKLLQKNVAEIKPDIVLQIFGKACAVKKCDIPFVMMLDYTVATAEENYPADRFLNLKAKEKVMDMERQTYKRADYLFPWSNLVALSLAKDYGIDPRKIEITGAGGNIQSQRVGEKKFGSKTLLFNGTDFYRKGGDILIDAFRIIHAMDAAVTLYIIGVEGVSTENVIYKGMVGGEELMKIFGQCDIVVAPARCDPFPGFIIEAMQFGVPCIVSDRDGMPEIVDHEQNGVVLQELSASGLATAIRLLINDQATLIKYSNAAKDKVKSTLNWDTVAYNMAVRLASCF